jgi:hypothetical protein
VAVQGILGVDVPRIAACVFLGLCLSVVLCVICVVEDTGQLVTCIVEVNKLKRILKLIIYTF